MAKLLPSASSIIAVRTNKLDQLTRELVAELRTLPNYQVIICADETNADIGNIEGIAKISVSKDRYKSMGLFTELDTMWRCGDYCLYAITEDIVDIKRIWMIEPDVYINSKTSEFFITLEIFAKEIDFVAVRFTKAHPNSAWQETILPFYANNYVCQYPFIGITVRAVEVLRDERRRISEYFFAQTALTGKITGMYPNDEVFTATVCMNNGFKCADLNSFGKTLYSGDSFSYVVPMSKKYLQLSRHDGMVHHPVATGDVFKARAESFLAFCRNRVEPKDLKRVVEPILATIGHKLALEVGYDFAIDYLNELSELLTEKTIK